MILSSMVVWRRKLGLRKVVIEPVRCPLTYEEFRLEEFGRDRGGTWVDEIPNGNDHLIDTVRYTVRDDVLRGTCEAQNVTDRARRRPRAWREPILAAALYSQARIFHYPLSCNSP